jgi:hypothetical protein
LTIKIEDLLAWQPDNFSEDHVSNFLVQVFKKSKKWHIVYYNPPHGSWKSMVFIKGNYEYRQVGPKRGVKLIKRPDVAVQLLPCLGDSMFLLLIEAKQNRDAWTPELLTLLKAYFEGYKGSNALRLIPFTHKRKIGENYWEELQPDETDTKWFQKCKVTYHFGFAYNLGAVGSKVDLSLETSWMVKTLENLPKPTPPIILMAIGWFNDIYKPFIIMKCSETFSKYIIEKLQDVFSNYLYTPEKRLLSLNNFI